MTITNLERQFLSHAKAFHEEAWALNLYLADHPEVSGRETKAVAEFTEILERHGIPCEKGVCGIDTAFKGVVKEGGPTGVKVAILAEYDALPGIGHACGHSASAAVSLLAALAVKSATEDFDATIHIIGTPDEEDEGMKIPMAERGYFDDYDFAIMVHMDSEFKANWRMLAYETYDFAFKGRAAHAAAAPWHGKNAVNGMMLMIHAFDMMRQKLKDGSRVEGYILEGGVASNIIPDRALCQYTFRATEMAYLKEEILPMAFDAAKGCAIATQTEVAIRQHGNSYFDMKTNQSGEEAMARIFEDYGFYDPKSGAIMGSSDMGNVSYRCPAFHPSVPVLKDGKLHTVEFESAMRTPEAKQAILDGATIILAFIARTVETESLVEAIKKDFQG